MQGERLRTVRKFNYLGSVVEENGELDEEVVHRVQTGWRNWEKVTGVLCDKRISAQVKGKVYKSVVRPAMTMHGSKTWVVQNAQVKKQR